MMYDKANKKRESQVRIFEENEIHLRALKFRTGINYQEFVNALMQYSFSNPQCIQRTLQKFFDMDITEEEARALTEPL